MSAGNQPNRFNETIGDLKDYVCLYLDKFKLKALDNLSTVTNTVFNTLLYIVCIIIAIIFLVAGTSIWLGEIINSYVGAMFIMAGFFIVLAIFIYALRKRLFVNSFVRMYKNIMFDNDKHDEDDE